MKVMLLGDTHSNTKFVKNVVIPAAIAEGVSWIYQVGDFGYWEHTDDGIDFLDEVNRALVGTGIQIVFIQGNHDKVSIIPVKYPEVFGFYSVRTAIWFAPNGTVWSPNDGKTNFLALGGAYSVDKTFRIEEEERQAARLFKTARFQAYSSEGYALAEAKRQSKETLWFPEEEMSEDAFSDIMKNTTDRIDVILAHDKPLASNPMVKLMRIPECEPNQRRLQEAVNKFKPKLFVHGHLHCRYTDTVRCGDNDSYTRIEGLGADVPNFNQTASSWEPTNAWEFLTL